MKEHIYYEVEIMSPPQAVMEKVKAKFWEIEQQHADAVVKLVSVTMKEPWGKISDSYTAVYKVFPDWESSR